MLEGVKKAHFIGICGAGMAPTAKLLRDSGIMVTGSDQETYPPISDFLKQEGLPCQTPYQATNIPHDADIIVIGKNAKLVPETNQEVQAAYESGKRILSYPEVLGELSKDKETIIVAGSYGKSTSAALMSHVLEVAGKDPSYFIGAVPYTPSSPAYLGRSNLFVLEGDEYPSSNTDTRSKFMHYFAKHLLLTPLAHDHVNVFPTEESYLAPFKELVKNISGTMVVCSDGPLSRELVAQVPQCIPYSFDTAKNVSWGERTSFELNGMRLETTLLGKHNIQNIVGVATLLLSLTLVTPEELRNGVETFKGIRRRLDKLSEKTYIPVFEGFGSSFEKARAAIEAIKLHFPQKRLVVIFEPHTFSWRNRDALSWYDTAFEGADKVFIYEPASQGATTHQQLSQDEIVKRVTQAGFDAEKLSGPDIPLTENDALLILTSGDLGGFIGPIVALAEEKFPI